MLVQTVEQLVDIVSLQMLAKFEIDERFRHTDELWPQLAKLFIIELYMFSKFYEQLIDILTRIK